MVNDTGCTLYNGCALMSDIFMGKHGYSTQTKTCNNACMAGQLQVVNGWNTGLIEGVSIVQGTKQ